MNVVRGATLALAMAMAAPPAEQPALTKTTPYYPMQVGATCTYKSGESHFSLTVTKIEKVGTTMCARIELMQDGKVVQGGSEDVYLGDDGVYRLAAGDQQVDPPVLVLKLPPTKNDAWTFDAKAAGKAGAKESLRGTVTERDGEQVTVPAGSYTAVSVSCQDLDANGAKYAYTTWYAKDVGMVKQEINACRRKVTIELEKYEPAK
jgi:hypothetical protein